MQLLGSRSSEDGETLGLSIVDADVDRFRLFPEQKNLKIPHVGFSTVELINQSRIFNGFGDVADFYFTHSYRMICREKFPIIGQSVHGERFVAAIQKDNVFGTQFHPEKSQDNGLRLLRNFMEIK